MKYKLKQKTVEATQWFKDGDHVEIKPHFQSDLQCFRCGLTLGDHGMYQNQIVCPGTYLISKGLHLILMRPDEFEDLYEIV